MWCDFRSSVVLGWFHGSFILAWGEGQGLQFVWCFLYGFQIWIRCSFKRNPDGSPPNLTLAGGHSGGSVGQKLVFTPGTVLWFFVMMLVLIWFWITWICKLMPSNTIIWLYTFANFHNGIRMGSFLVFLWSSKYQKGYIPYVRTVVGKKSHEHAMFIRVLGCINLHAFVLMHQSFDA